MKFRPRQFLLKSLRVLALLSVLFAICLAALWLARTSLLSYAAKRSLQNLGIDQPEFAITTADLHSIAVEDIILESPDGKVSIERLEITYSPSTLLSEKRIQNLTVSKALAEIAIPLSSESTDSPEPSFNLDLEPYFPLPFKRIQILDSKILVSYPNLAPISANLDATLAAATPDTLSLEATLTRPNETLILSGQSSANNPFDLSAALQLDSPITLLDTYYPDWNSIVPDLHSLKSGPLELTTHIQSSTTNTPAISFTLSATELALAYEEIEAQFTNIQTDGFFQTAETTSDLHFHLVANPERLTRDTLSLAPNSPIDLQLKLRELNALSLKTNSPLNWNYDSGFATGSSTLDLHFDLTSPTIPLHGTVTTENIVVSEIQLQPTDLSLQGDLKSVAFTATPLFLSDDTHPLATKVQGSVHIPEPDDQPIKLTATALLHPDSLSQLPPETSLPTFDLSLTTQVFDISSHTLLDLVNQNGPATFSLTAFDQTTNATGDLKLHFDLAQDDASELFTGHATIDASNFSLQSPTLQGNGIALQAKTNFHDLNTDLANTELPASELLKKLLPQFDLNLDWQANQISTDTLTADWTGGSFTLQPTDAGLQTTSSFGAGILTLGALRLEQAYLENQFQGKLAQLSGTTSISALLDGVPLELTTTQTLSSPLENLSLKGEYTLTPTSFSHSDLLARFDPTFAGLTLSAKLSAAGAFTANTATADASLDLHLSEASLDYPASRINASGITANLHLASLHQLESGDLPSNLSVELIQAGDFQASQANASLLLSNGSHLQLDSASVNLFEGSAFLESTSIPIDGSDFTGQLFLENLSLSQIAQYIDIFDGSMEGSVSGYLPYRLHEGNFELLAGKLTLPDGTPATLHYRTKGLLTANAASQTPTKPTFSERLLKFLKIEPDAVAEQALGNITIQEFTAELFPEDAPETPIRIRIAGTAHSDIADIPVVISTQVHGSLTELYNFLIRLSSL
ncbi:hypothetical protein VDG1235_1969 [Verrucomicrobiia bacterium DG1235]|nr:hypothetical protein VDG1235_1969 [Verrucomicrobiae bacterium DG1235]